MPAVALSPVIATVAFAAAILLLSILAGPTFGALLAAPLFMPLLKMAGVSPRAATLVLVPALMLSYARPALGLSRTGKIGVDGRRQCPIRSALDH
jgi:hypothetical protein